MFCGNNGQAELHSRALNNIQLCSFLQLKYYHCSGNFFSWVDYRGCNFQLQRADVQPLSTSDDTNKQSLSRKRFYNFPFLNFGGDCFSDISCCTFGSWHPNQQELVSIQSLFSRRKHYGLDSGASFSHRNNTFEISQNWELILVE